MDLPPGTEIADRYTIERVLGHGGMGAVYVAHDHKFGEKVALKVAAAVGVAADQIRDRFRREARIGYKLGRSSGFVRAFDWGEFRDIYLYLALDLVEGACSLDLRSGTRRERLDRLKRACQLVAQAHAEGVVHRDLKPDNFLQAPDGSISLADFGLAKLKQGDDDDVGSAATNVDLTGTAMGMGTPRYMAPEQFEDAKNVDERADVYSLGVMLFVALTRSYPYNGHKAMEYVAQQARVRVGELPEPRPRNVDANLPESLDALCVQAIALDAAARVPTVDALVRGLDDARRTRRTPRPKRKVPKKRAAVDRAPAPPPGLQSAGEGEFIWPPDGSRLVWIPPGTFRMGSTAPQAAPDERPRFRVSLTRGLFLATSPVTWAQFRTYCGHVQRPLPEGGEDAPDAHPVVNVSWDEAVGYCRWAGLRLPTEAEWERAARGPDERMFPWGDELPDPTRCNWKDHPDYEAGTSPIGAFPDGASVEGCHDLAGNVWEWVFDWYDRYSRWIKTDPLGPESGVGKVARGGSWRAPALHCRTTTRRMLLPHMRATNLGFRVALSAAQD